MNTPKTDKKQTLPTNLTPDFLRKHPDYNGIVMLYLMGWTEEYGEDIVVEVVSDEQELSQRMPLYADAGYQLKDTNLFGNLTGVVGISYCYRKENESPMYNLNT